MGDLFFGIGQALGGVFGGPALQGVGQQYQMNLQQMKQVFMQQHQAIFPKIAMPILGIVDEPRGPHDQWLHERIGATRAKGKEWITSGRLQVVNRLGTREHQVASSTSVNATDGIPTKRLKNGDLVYVYPEDHHVPQEVLDRFAKANQENYGGYGI